MDRQEPGLPVPVSEVRKSLPRSLTVTVVAAMVVVVLGLFLVLSRSGLEPPPAVVGEWTAVVDYGRGAVRTERLEFRLTGTQLSGSATLHGARRIIEQAEYGDDYVRFVTRSRERVGAEQRELVHRYEGEVARDVIRFTLVSDGGFREHDPVTFEARRQ